MGVDANGSLFPLAYAVVNAENDSNWLWFFKHLRDVLEIHTMPLLSHNSSDQLVFLLDRQKASSKELTACFQTLPTRTASVISKTTCTSNSNIQS